MRSPPGWHAVQSAERCMHLVARSLSSPIPRVLVTPAQRGTAGDLGPARSVFFLWTSELVASPGNGYYVRIRTLLRGFTERFADQGDGERQIIMHQHQRVQS
jgi:hypothetical protein